VKIAFLNQDIESICRQPKLATKRVGDLSAKKLQRRLGELFAASFVTDLVAGRPHPLKGGRLGQFAVDLHGGSRLVFKPTKQPPPVKEDSSIDWGKVEDITVIEVGDYHE
jgi:toxin HigB-1